MNKLGIMGYEKRYPDTQRYPVNYEIRKDKKFLSIFDGFTKIEIPIKELREFIKE